jgi:hypothetical protein
MGDLIVGVIVCGSGGVCREGYGEGGDEMEWK